MKGFLNFSSGQVNGPLDLQKENPKRTLIRVLSSHGEIWTFFILLLLVIVFGIANSDFFSRSSWLATSQYAVEYLLLGLGETFVIITGGIDLSVGAVLGFSAMIGGMVMRTLLQLHMGSGISTCIGIVVAVGSGTLLGWVNGVLITKLRLTPFIVTLSMLSICTGGIYLLNNGQNIDNIPNIIGFLGSYVILRWMPVTVLITGFFCIIAAILLGQTRFGLRTYAIGSNPLGASRAGINVDRHLIKVYMLAGFFSAVAGLMVMARFSSASVQAGANDELDAITAVVIGGASLFGGRGTILGTVIGGFVITAMVTGLILVGVQPFWQQVAVGMILIFAVATDQIRSRMLNIV